MRSTDALIRNGRNPPWRIAWGGLDRKGRERVRGAFKDGTKIEDPALEPFAQGFLARAERAHRWAPYQVGFTALLCGLWLYATAVLRPSLWAALYLALLLVDLVWGPVKYRRASKQIANARQAATQARTDGER